MAAVVSPSGICHAYPRNAATHTGSQVQHAQLLHQPPAPHHYNVVMSLRTGSNKGRIAFGTWSLREGVPVVLGFGAVTGQVS
jgi:hypothetical protein